MLLLRVETLARHPARLRVESVALGEFEMDVATASLLDRDVDVLWVAPKAAELEAALELALDDVEEERQALGNATYTQRFSRGTALN